MDYFRAVLKTNELSERALTVTTAVIEWNPANYTAWFFRRLILEALPNTDWANELEFVSEQAREHPKNYQIWNHRQIVVEKLGSASEELDFIQQIHNIDSKNYHAWAHRQWVVSNFNLWDNELEATESELVKDVRNNSAWNHRYFVVQNTTKLSTEARRKEISYAAKKIAKAPNNESSWNYLNGFVVVACFVSDALEW